jgi:hypothetical protein
MKKNMGIVDRVTRMVIAVIFVSLYASGIIQGTTGIVLIALSIVFVLTSFLGFCPLYLPLGISTVARKLQKKS